MNQNDYNFKLISDSITLMLSWQDDFFYLNNIGMLSRLKKVNKKKTILTSFT